MADKLGKVFKIIYLEFSLNHVRSVFFSAALSLILLNDNTSEELHSECCSHHLIAASNAMLTDILVQ